MYRQNAYVPPPEPRRSRRLDVVRALMFLCIGIPVGGMLLSVLHGVQRYPLDAFTVAVFLVVTISLMYHFMMKEQKLRDIEEATERMTAEVERLTSQLSICGTDEEIKKEE